MNENSSIRKIDLTATFALIGALVFWALGPIFIKYLTGYLDSWTQNLLRYSVGCLFWLPFLLFSIMKKHLDTNVWRKAVIPAVANILMQSLFACAFYYINPAFMVLLMKTSIVFTATFSLIFFFEERTLIKSKRFWSGLVLLAAGVFGVIYYKEDFSARQTLTGIIITLAAAFMWSVYVLSAKIAFKDIDSRQGFSVVSIYTVTGLFVLTMLFGRTEDCLKLNAWHWTCIIISGITSISLAHTLYYVAMKHIGATIPALVILAQPFIVIAISYVVFRESLNAFQFFFGIVLLAGAALAIWAQQHLKNTE
jgi:drug/metabolite transporter (DMT)-like permease